MKTILRIDHLDLLLPEGANVTLLLKTLSKAQKLEYIHTSTTEERYRLMPIRELKVQMMDDSQIRIEPSKKAKKEVSG